LAKLKKVWDLFENKHLFNAVDETGKPLATHHIAEIVAFLGLPPHEYIHRSEVTNRVFDSQGQWFRSD
jgi:serine/threonine-protein kinase SRPK3